LKECNLHDLLNNGFFRTKVFSVYSFLSIEALYLNPCATWNTTGITVIGTNSPGNTSNALNLPEGIFLHRESNTLYVADTGNRRIQMISLNQSSTMGVTVASNIDSLTAIYVDDNGTTIYAALRYQDRVVKLTKNASSSVEIGDQCKQCAGVWVDSEKNVYMTESGTHSILKWSPKTNTTVSVAGRTDEEGHSPDHLYFPTGIYLNRLDNALYIADTRNNRIQKWNNNSQEGITVAGSEDGVEGSDASKLANPLSVWADEGSEVVYIADSDNNRIQRWFTKATNGTTIAGGAGNLFFKRVTGI